MYFIFITASSVIINYKFYSESRNKWKNIKINKKYVNKCLCKSNITLVILGVKLSNFVYCYY